MSRLMFSIATCAICLMLGSCGSTDPQPSLAIPTRYDSASYTLNAATEIAMIGQFEDLIEALEKGRASSVRLNESEILLKLDVLLPFMDPLAVNEVTSRVLSTIRASGGTYDWSKDAAGNGEGGVYGAYLFTAEGLDATEVVEKQLFSVMLQYHVNQLLLGTTTPATIDKLVATIGAHPKFSNSDKATSHPDRFVAAYAARRDKNDGTGMYTKIFASLRKAQAAAKAGTAFSTDLNDAIKEYRRQWERALMATTANYLFTVVSKLSQTTVDDATRSSAIHSFGEAAGYLMGLTTVPQNQRIIPSETLQTILAKMGLPLGGSPSCWKVWQDPFTSLPLLIECTNIIATTYGFSSAEMESFKTNWVNAQDRK